LDVRLRNLPIVVVLEIFKKLSLKDLSSSVLVSRQWRDIVHDPVLWKQFPMRVKLDSLNMVHSMLARTRFSLVDTVKITDNFWCKLMPEQIQNLVKEISKKKNVRRIFLSLERDVLESPDPDKSKALVGELPSNVELGEANCKVLQLRPVRVGIKITYKYRVLFTLQINLL